VCVCVCVCVCVYVCVWYYGKCSQRSSTQPRTYFSHQMLDW